MNHTIKGIFIVAAIASMLVVGLSMVPLAQNTYASSHRQPKSQDNIANQQDDTYRSPGSESSNVAVQESGKGNSATSFSDQSSNLQQQQNQPTSSQQQDPQANKDKDNKFPITLNVLPYQRIINTNVNPNTNTASSNSSSASNASNDNTIDNTALARQRQAEASCAVAVTCPEGSTTVTPPPTTGTLRITKMCNAADATVCGGFEFPITVTGNNPQPPSFTLSNGESQTVTLGPGSFTIHESTPDRLRPGFAGDCMQTGPFDATGTISAGQTLTCLITNGQGPG